MPQVKEGLKRTSEDMKECQEKVKVQYLWKAHRCDRLMQRLPAISRRGS